MGLILLHLNQSITKTNHQAVQNFLKMNTAHLFLAFIELSNLPINQWINHIEFVVACEEVKMGVLPIPVDSAYWVLAGKTVNSSDDLKLYRLED